jgi:type IV secretion system protein VirD4
MIRIINFIFELLFLLLSEIVSGLFDFIASIIQPKRKTEYDADFISASDILEKNGTGFCLTGNKYTLSDNDSFRHAVVIGNSGSSKTSSVIIPNIWNLSLGNSSLVINDPSSELRKRLSGVLKQRGYDIKIIDYSDCRSIGWNPILRLKTKSEIKQLASLLIESALGNSSEKFWNLSAADLISFFIYYLIKYEPLKYRNLLNVLHLINLFAGNPEKMDRLIVMSKDEMLLAEYKAMVALGDKTLMSIVITAKTALSIISDENIAKITSTTEYTLDVETFRKNRVALFINTSIPMIKHASVLSSLFFQQFIDEILITIPEDGTNNLYLILDETASMILPLETAMNYLRKYRVGLFLVLQDKIQLDMIYGVHKAKNIFTNCFTKIFMPGATFETCQMLEKMLGIFEFEDELTGSKRTRQLLTSDEIRKTNKAIIFVGNNAPLHENIFPYFENKKFKALTEIPPIEPNNNLPVDTPPIIDVSDESKR